MNDSEPDFDQSLPDPPDWLSDKAVRHFITLRDRIAAMGYASSSHTEMLALTASALEIAELADKDIKAHGMNIETTNQQGDWVVKQNPAVNQKLAAMNRAQKLMSEFGLSPSSAPKVSVPGKKKKNSSWSNLRSS